MMIHGCTAGAISILMKGVSANFEPHFAPFTAFVRLVRHSKIEC